MGIALQTILKKWFEKDKLIQVFTKQDSILYESYVTFIYYLKIINITSINPTQLIKTEITVSNHQLYSDTTIDESTAIFR